MPTSANSEAPLELSGSLTGLVLAQGNRADQQPADRSRNRKVVVTLTVAVILVLIVGALVAYFAGGIIGGLVHGAGNG